MAASSSKKQTGLLMDIQGNTGTMMVQSWMLCVASARLNKVWPERDDAALIPSLHS